MQQEGRRDSGVKVAKSIVLIGDIRMVKKALYDDIASGTVKPMMAYLSDEDARKAKGQMIRALTEE